MNLCECGCGQPTQVIARTDNARGLVAGQYRRFVSGHSDRNAKPAFIVDGATRCWVWQRGKTSAGYGEMTVAGQTKYAHRVFYETFVGKIPDGLHIDHLCRNKSCVNPLHLEPVTNRENVLRGAKTQVPAQVVTEIRQAVAQGEPTAAIGARFGVTDAYVRHVATGKRRLDAGGSIVATMSNRSPRRAKATPVLVAQIRFLRASGMRNKDIASHIGLSPSYTCTLAGGVDHHD